MAALNLIVGAVLGAVIGSYLTCATWRIPRRMPLTGRSVCASCGGQLKDSWNIPIVGWLALRGRSGCCSQPISVRYPLIELVSAVVGAALGALLGLVAVEAAAVGIVVVTVAASLATLRR